MPPSSIRTALCLGLCCLGSFANLAAADFGSRDLPLFETGEWSFTDSSVSGEAFWHHGTVTFTHSATGITRTTTTFYDGGDTWRFRFFADRPGEWTFLSSAADPDQDGHHGTIQVGDPVSPDKHGPIRTMGDRYVVQEADGGWRAIYHQVFQNGESDKDGSAEFAGLKFVSYLNKTESEQLQMIETHLDRAEAHGISGIFISVEAWRDGSTGLPRLDTFRLFERLQERIWARNMHFHMWMWGDNGGTDSVTMLPELYRYLGARISALGSWSADRGYDTGGKMPLGLSFNSHASWGEHLRQYLPWNGPIGVRSHASHQLDYISNDINQNNLFENEPFDGYPSELPQDPYRITRWMYDDLPLTGQPHIYMRRLWLGRSQLTTDQTLACIWGFMFGGGAAADLGFGEPDQQSFERPERFLHIRRFLVDTERWRLDLEPVDGNSSAWMLSNPDRSRTLLYQRGTDTVSVDLTGSPSGLPVIAVDTEATTYTELDLGTAGGSQHSFDLPTTSHWALAIGDFSQEYRLRSVEAGPDRLVRDASGNGWAGVALSALGDPGLTGYSWSWSGGSASGQSVLIDLPLGEHAITCTGSNPEGPDPSDVVWVRVVDTVDSGVLYVVGNSTWFEGEDLTVGPAVSADNSWTVKSSSEKRGSKTSGGNYLNGDGSSSDPTGWADARDASVVVDMASGKSLAIYLRVFGTSSAENLMVGLDGDFHAYGATFGTFRKPWHWIAIDEPLFISAGRHELQFRQALNGDLDLLHLGAPDAWPSRTGGSNPVLADEDGPGLISGDPPQITAGPSVDPDPVTDTSATASVTASDPDGDDAALIADWSVSATPAGAPLPTFTPAGSNDAMSTTVTFSQAGDYELAVRVIDEDGAFVDGTVAVTVEQTAAAIEVTP